MKLGKANHLQVVGSSGTGKSTLVRILVPEKAGDRVLILDPDEDYEPGELVEHRAFALEGLDAYLKGVEPGEPFSVSYVPAFGQEQEAARVLALYAMELGDTTLIVDEGHRALSYGKSVPDEVVRVAKQGRKRGVGFWALSQRPVDIAPAIAAELESHESWFLRLARHRDVTYVAGVMGPEFARRVKTLPDMHVLRLGAGASEPEEWRIVDYSRLERV